jgi:hypothetical protein
MLVPMMNRDWLTSTPPAASVARIEGLLLWLLGVLAALTVLTHAAQLIHVSFSAYASLAAVVTLVMTGSWAFLAKGRSRTGCTGDSWALGVVVALGLLGGALALAINRPDADDYYYVPNAVYFLQHPREPMGFDIHFLDGGGRPLSSFFWGTSGPYEYIQAILAYFLGLDYLWVYYFIAPAIVGFLIPIALYLGITHFSDSSLSAVVGTLVAFCCILLLGETHRTFGNLSVARAFQGKAVLLGFGIPLFVALSLDYFRRDGPLLRWVLLSSAATAMLGASSSAVFLLPSLALLMAISWLVTVGGVRKAATRILGYVLCLWYVAFFGLCVFGSSVADLAASSPVNRGWPTDFGGHLSFLINARAPVTLVLLLTSTILSLLLTSRLQRIFLAVWVVSAIVFFANPVVAPFLIEHVTSPNAYWRMFYLYPLPLVVGIAAAGIFSRTAGLSVNTRTGIVAAAFACLLSMHFALPSASVLRGPNVQVGWPALKVPATLLERARQVVLLAPPGVMLAPKDLAGMIAMLNSNHPQLCIREGAVRLWLANGGQGEDAELRIRASDFVSGSGEDFSALRTVVEQNSARLRSIVIKDSVDNDDRVKDLLVGAHFGFRRSIPGYVVVWH